MNKTKTAYNYNMRKTYCCSMMVSKEEVIGKNRMCKQSY